MKQIRRICLTAMAVILLCTAVCGCLNSCGAAGDVSIIDGKEIRFVSDTAKSKWEKPLIRLLSNEVDEFSDAPIPDKPCIARGYSCGLLDMNHDGVPELLVHPNGFFGSSGAVTYYVYDILTGRCIGGLDSGSGTWCDFYNRESDCLDLIGEYSLRSGDRDYSAYTCQADYPASEGKLSTRMLFRSHQFVSWEFEPDNPGNAHSDMPIYRDVYGSTELYVPSGGPTSWAEYHRAYTDFRNTHIMIPETKLQMISWSSVTDDKDDAAARAAKMAHALLHSTQKFAQIP